MTNLNYVKNMKNITGGFQMNPKSTLLSCAFLTIFLFHIHAEDLLLSENGKTTYTIYADTRPGSIDDFAVKELREHLRKITDADFILKQEPTAGKTIFVGKTPAAQKALGKDGLWDNLKDQEAVIQTKDGNLFLYGSGSHGNLYAVYELLENKFGCRWLTPSGDNYIPKKNRLTIAEGVYKSHYDIPIRSITNKFYVDLYRAYLFDYRNRQNLKFDRTAYGGKVTKPAWERGKNPGIYAKDRRAGLSYHTLPIFIPGLKGSHSVPDWIPVKDYFKIHPEWFSMDKQGRRVNNRQLCFSNPELARELEKNAVEYHRRLEEENGPSYLQIDLNDYAFNTCYCPSCQSLQKKYKTPGGAFFECLFRICEAHKNIEFITLAYQKTLTQIPPTGLKVPRNLTVIYCDINGNFAGTLEKENKEELEYLIKWKQLAKAVWYWYYPNTYNLSYQTGLIIVPPLANFERLAEDIKTMHKYGVDGTYFEHNVGGLSLSGNLSEMQSYVMLKLFQNVNQDVHALMKDFADHFYGKASGMILQFAKELEDGRKATLAKGKAWVWNTQNYDYLTEGNLLRWNKMFDDASKDVDDELDFRLRLARMGLDSIIIHSLWGNQDRLVEICSERLEKTLADIQNKKRNINGLPWTNHYKKAKLWLKKMSERVPPAPLPETIKNVSKDSLRIVVPDFEQAGKNKINDRQANFETALVTSWDNKSFQMALFDDAKKVYGQGNGLTIYANEVKQGTYQLYKYPRSIELRPNRVIKGKNGAFRLHIGRFCSHDDHHSMTRKYDLYVSLKFTDGKVFMDRGFLISKD